MLTYILLQMVNLQNKFTFKFYLKRSKYSTYVHYSDLIRHMCRYCPFKNISDTGFFLLFCVGVYYQNSLSLTIVYRIINHYIVSLYVSYLTFKCTTTSINEKYTLLLLPMGYKYFECNKSKSCLIPRLASFAQNLVVVQESKCGQV